MNVRKIVWFLVLAFGISWGIALAYYLGGGRLTSPGAALVLVCYMFGPLTAALLVQVLVARELDPVALGVSFRLNRWWWAAWLGPPLAALLTLGISLLIPGVEYSPEMAGLFARFQSVLTPEQVQQMKDQLAALPVHPLWLALLSALVAGPTVNALAAFGEEAGWRGLLQDQLAPLGFWPSSLVIGFIWGVWHAPIILQGHNYPQHPLAGVFMMTAWCMLLSPLLCFVRLQASSVVAAAVAHGTLNACAGIPLMVIVGGNDLLVGLTGLAGFVAAA
ncbi:MAG: CPBP family glutamic-type intramembrane protease, partial [Syntrophomonadaceae bacterium]|nr:CPBP family glutamic-type intramembrane protease [Syntrophomonadaceae bacterium]